MHADSEIVDRGLGEALASAAAVLYGSMKARIRRLTRASVAADATVMGIVKNLRRDGFAVLPAYYTAEECAQGRAEIDAMIAARPDAIQSFGQGSDLRIYGSEHASSLARRFHDDALFLEVGRAYRRGPLTNFSTLAARLTAKPGNQGSGQGWHRDAFYFQFKSMVYLSDVGLENGPFQILFGSHRALRVAFDSLVGRLDKPPASRISTAQIARLLASTPKRALPLPAPAGTVILFDSSTIHRGMPIQAGVRYALTNYFYAPADLTTGLRDQFKPMLAP